MESFKEVISQLNYHLVKDCYWFFKRLLETGDDPVFIFSELMKRRTGNNDNLLNHELI